MSDRALPLGKLPAALLRELLSLQSPSPRDVLLPPAIGEDAGVVGIAGGALIAATDPVTLTGHEAGGHCVLINANDIAVMGARPRWFLCTILLPVGSTEADARSLFDGIYGALGHVGAVLVGGHTEVTQAVAQSIVVGQMLGYREDGRYLCTGGVGEGDVILQIGQAPIEGAAVLATEAAGRLDGMEPQVLQEAREALRTPGITVVEPALRATALGATALHDPTEGGLSAGLHELAEASGLALCLDADSALWFAPGIAICTRLGADPWGTLASGTLLAAFPPGTVDGTRAALESDGYAVAAVAQAVKGAGVRRVDDLPFPRYERDEVSRVLSTS